jgi:hypothetical protein
LRACVVQLKRNANENREKMKSILRRALDMLHQEEYQERREEMLRVLAVGAEVYDSEETVEYFDDDEKDAANGSE